VGINVTPGSGVAAAGEYWRSTAPAIPGRVTAGPPETATKAAEGRAAKAGAAR
jgi:hypothetical protein